MLRPFAIVALLWLGLPSPTADATDPLVLVQAAVNREIKYVSEPAGRDLWQVGVSEGDCEEFALEKRRRLIALGWDETRLEVLLIRPADQPRTLHAILLADGGAVLDQRRERVVALPAYLADGTEWVCIADDLRPIDRQALSRCRR